MNPTLLYMLAVVNMISLVHLGLFIVGANVYDIKKFRENRRPKQPSTYQPLVSVVVPAHNESLVIRRTLDSILASTYQNIEVIVVDDGSTDATSQIVHDYIAHLPQARVGSTMHRKANIQRRLGRDLRLEVNRGAVQRRFDRQQVQIRTVRIAQKNGGKAAALNNAIANTVKGDLTMCLDADSVLHRESIKRAVRYFRDPKIMGVAANVRLIDTGTILSKVQRFEHLVGYRSKKFYSMTNTEFIIGGVASTYRTDLIKEVGLYDSDTMTEDIGLSMKLIASLGNKQQRVIYASDVVAMTEGVHSFKGLLQQRYRWKIGCLQNLFKYRSMIGRGETGKHSWLLTKYRLPMALIGELQLLLGPLLLTYIVYLSFYYQTFGILLGAYMTITLYVMWTLWPDEHLTIKEKWRMSLSAFAMYGLFYIMDFVQIAAIYRSIRNYRKIIRSDEATTWVSPTRAGHALTFSR
ncbi:glycosyltransferase family 2 protein [Candidatus Saccharibacteria bacterium]|nr:glycosyltransferase family 2 protein [Candidatus Saccharibacteria bacterium]